MKRIYLGLFLPFFISSYVLGATYYSISSGPWSDPSNWSTHESGSPVSSIAPTPNDDVVIRDNITHSALPGYEHFGNIEVQSGATYFVITGFGVSDPFYFAGGLFEVFGNVIFSSDFHNQRPGTNDYGIVRFNENSTIRIRDDLVVNARSVTIMNNVTCGADAALDDIYYHGEYAQVCGNGNFVVEGTVQARDINGLFDGKIADPAKQTCAGFDLYASTSDCNNGIVMLSGEGPPPSVFPVEFLEFAAVPENGRVRLNWATGSEIDNAYFSVERSIDNRVFETIEQVDGAGNSVVFNAYTAWDNSPIADRIYYRIKQTDYDGKFSYSEVVEVLLDQDVARLVKVYPNPAADNFINLELNGWESDKELNIRIVDVMGRVLLEDKTSTSGVGGLFKRMDLNLLPGNYFIQVHDGGHAISERFIKL